MFDNEKLDTYGNDDCDYMRSASGDTLYADDSGELHDEAGVAYDAYQDILDGIDTEEEE